MMRSLAILTVLLCCLSALGQNVLLKFANDGINSGPLEVPSDVVFVTSTNLRGGFTSNVTVAAYATYRPIWDARYRQWDTTNKLAKANAERRLIRAGYARPMRAGVEAVTTGRTNYVIAFDDPLPNTNYAVIFNASGLAAIPRALSRTADGFTLNMTVPVVGNVEWIAVHYDTPSGP